MCTVCQWPLHPPKNVRVREWPRRKTSPGKSRIRRGKERFSDPSQAADTESAQHRGQAPDHENQKIKSAHDRTTGRRGCKSDSQCETRHKSWISHAFAPGKVKHRQVKHRTEGRVDANSRDGSEPITKTQCEIDDEILPLEPRASGGKVRTVAPVAQLDRASDF